MLILHLDADKLRADGLHLQKHAELATALSSAALGSDVAMRDATSVDDLHDVLRQLALSNKTFDVIVVIAHSNAQEIRIARDRVVPWEIFRQYLDPFKPRRLLLVACRAGRWDAGEALFNGIPTLRRIFACPVNASKDFGSLMLLAVPYVVARRRPNAKHVFWSQVAAVALTGRQLREWRRTTDVGNPDSMVFDFIADAVNPAAEAVPEMLKQLSASGDAALESSAASAVFAV